jgi:hypothetical protein
MDFSSVPRALESLGRRQPPLQERVLQSVEKLRNENDFAALMDLIQEGTDRWEPLAVGLYVATEILQKQGQVVPPQVYMDGPRVPSTIKEDDVNETAFIQLDESQTWKLCETLHATAMQHLEHKEPRVRTLVAKAVGAYCEVTSQVTSELATGAAVREEVHSRLLSSIHQHIVEGREEVTVTGAAVDDTTGWRALETNWLCLAALIRAMGPQYLQQFPFEASDILEDAKYSCITHVNRHVRAAGMSVLEQCVVASAGNEAALQGPLRTTIKAVLIVGLADNWSQVRMGASVLCRVLFTALTDEEHLQDLYVALLPRMCFNRFYLAQGVKLYSHETWKVVFPNGGIERVVEYLPAISRYYRKMCDADNHVVREGACQAIAELASRLGPNEEHRQVLAPHVPGFLQALIMCFHDESWPVRDEACLACGILCKSFPEDCRPEFKTLWERWTEQLTDQIWSCRQNAAVAMGDALEAYGTEVWTRLQNEEIPKILPAAKTQPIMSREEYKAHVNNIEMHTDSQLYSCGSLAPKLKKAGAGRIGCGNCGVDRPKAPWEATDGCIYLFRELCMHSSENTTSGVEITDAILVPLLTELADVCRVDHFPQADELRTTLWRQLPAMAHALGKQRFKRVYLHLFMELLFRDLESRSASLLNKHAAGQCAADLANLVGLGIFRGRLEEDSQRELLDRVLREQGQHKEPMDAFSPFGPPGLLDHIGGMEISAAGRFPS